MWVDRFDPGALRRTRASARSRPPHRITGRRRRHHLCLGPAVLSTDAAAVDRNSPDGARCARTTRERSPNAVRTRSARSRPAPTSWPASADHRVPAADDDGQGSNVVIHVLAEPDALAAEPDPAMSGSPESPSVTMDMTLAEALAPSPEPHRPPRRPPQSSRASGIVPPPLLAELIRSGARVRRATARREARTRLPAVHGAGRVRPTAGPDLPVPRTATCRPRSATSTTRFRGPGDRRACVESPKPSAESTTCSRLSGTAGPISSCPTGTVVWTSPAGGRYVTHPGSRLLVPQWDTTTAELPRPTGEPPHATGVMMPTRRRTRAASACTASNGERALNDSWSRGT